MAYYTDYITAQKSFFVLGLSHALQCGRGRNGSRSCFYFSFLINMKIKSTLQVASYRRLYTRTYVRTVIYSKIRK